MALKKETLQKIAALAKVKVEDLETAIKDEKEVDVAIPDKLSTFTDDEVQTLKSNEYKSGKEAGVEMAVKESKEKLGLSFTGKTIDGLIDAATKKALEDAKIAPDAKVQELEGKITTLQTTVKDYETKLAEKDNEVSGIRINSELYKHIPAPGDNGPAISQDDVIGLMKSNGYEFKIENGATVAYKGGKKVTDKLSNDMPLNEVVTGFLKEKKIIADDFVPGGRGGGDDKRTGKATKLSELKKEAEAKGLNLMGEEFNKLVEQAVKDNKEFDLAS
jgi:hypothetical protein